MMDYSKTLHNQVGKINNTNLIQLHYNTQESVSNNSFIAVIYYAHVNHPSIQDVCSVTAVTIRKLPEAVFPFGCCW